MSLQPVPKFVVPPNEQNIRSAAIEPERSVFLSANAGSGKTSILTRRVIRLLLGGAEPSQILCLTYTKAAAAEMQDRIFADLARWVELDDEALSVEIRALSGLPPAPRDLRDARRLFARAIETPGGLKLQTIHAFAERLLHLFPFEANVPARFEVMDDLARSDLLAAARRGTFLEALATPQSEIGEALSALALQLSEEGLAARLGEALQNMRSGTLCLQGPRTGEVALRQALDLGPDETPGSVAGAIIGGHFPIADWPAAAEDIATGTTKDQRFAAGLRAAFEAPTSLDQALLYARLLVYAEDSKAKSGDGPKKGDAKKSVLTRASEEDMPLLNRKLLADAQRMPALLDSLKRLETLKRSAHLWVLADEVHRRFTEAKKQRGLADFDDLIERTVALLGDNGAAWVLCKLDAGLAHVLVDEAQDTTPAMWRIVRALTEEFFAGQGASSVHRTIFAVGDEKQSIYSFQGAAPKSFAEERRHYAQRLKDQSPAFVAKELKLSFRTTGDVLSFVDHVFADPARRAGLSADDVATVHEAAREGAPGFVELWPLLQSEKEEPRDPTEPVDAVGRHSAQVLLAEKIAGHIRILRETGRFDDDGAPIRAGDIMILVQSRDAFFEAVIRALKRAGVPVAGADRITLGEQIAVLDLLAAARVALLPADDLAVAEVLKGPFIGLTDADLIALAPGRSGSLLAALATSDDPAHRAAFARIEGWRFLVRERLPSGFFSAILGPEGGRKALLGRLGLDAAEAVDVFVTQVQDYEQREPPSLAGFLAAFATFEGDVKRDQEQAGDAVRVLTVHGAKGLEARIVFLADTTRIPHASKEPRLFESQGALLWSRSRHDDPAILTEMKAEARAARMEEYRRLLYVAMTRARDRLYVAGSRGEREIAATSWYAMIAETFAAQSSQPLHDDRGKALPRVKPCVNESGHEVQRWRSVAGARQAPKEEGASVASPAPLPSWITQRLVPEPAPVPPLRPSRAVDAAEDAAEASRAGVRLRGDLVHGLLELLPEVAEADRSTMAQRHLAAVAPGLTDKARARIADEALALLASPETQGLFGSGSRAEAPVAGEIMLPAGATIAVSGRIDRLLIRDDRIVIADFKSGRPGPAEDHATQLALYRALFARIYPARPILCLVVWTRDAQAVLLDDAALDAALARIKPP